MKKVLAILLMVVLVAAMGITAYAAPSAEAQGVVSGATAVDKDGNTVDFVLEKIDGKVDKDFQKTLTDLKTEKDDDSLKVVGQYKVIVNDDAKYPLSVSLKVLGISKNSSVHILAKKGKEVIVITPDVDGNKLSFELDKNFNKIAIVTDGKTADKVEKENGVLSPQTGDATVFVAIAAFISLLGIAFLPKKIKE